jgi:hypothetical protein
MLPAFLSNGLLPAGVHVVVWADLRNRFGGSLQRLQILGGLERAAWALRQARCRRLWVDGSFATGKSDPGDWDGCWDPSGIDLRLLDPLLQDFSAQGRARMKMKYVADLFPSTYIEKSSTSTFLEYFQVDKQTGLPKGIVQLNLWGTP